MMKIRHTKKSDTFRYLPDDKSEPKLGAIVTVENDYLGHCLIARGWGEEVKATPPPASSDSSASLPADLEAELDAEDAEAEKLLAELEAEEKE